MKTGAGSNGRYGAKGNDRMQDAVRGFIALAAQVGLNFDFLTSPFELRMWLDGMTTTLVLVALTIPLSLAGGVGLAAALTSDRPWLAGPARAYVELTRNTPTLVQLMFTVLVVNMLISQALGGAQNNPLGAYFWLVAVISLHVAALHAEALRGGIEEKDCWISKCLFLALLILNIICA